MGKTYVKDGSLFEESDSFLLSDKKIGKIESGLTGDYVDDKRLGGGINSVDRNPMSHETTIITDRDYWNNTESGITIRDNPFKSHGQVSEEWTRSTIPESSGSPIESSESSESPIETYDGGEEDCSDDDDSSDDSRSKRTPDSHDSREETLSDRISAGLANMSNDHLLLISKNRGYDENIREIAIRKANWQRNESDLRDIAKEKQDNIDVRIAAILAADWQDNKRDLQAIAKDKQDDNSVRMIVIRNTNWDRKESDLRDIAKDKQDDSLVRTEAIRKTDWQWSAAESLRLIALDKQDDHGVRMEAVREADWRYNERSLHEIAKDKQAYIMLRKEAIKKAGHYWGEEDLRRIADADFDELAAMEEKRLKYNTLTNEESEIEEESERIKKDAMQLAMILTGEISGKLSKFSNREIVRMAVLKENLDFNPKDLGSASSVPSITSSENTTIHKENKGGFWPPEIDWNYGEEVDVSGGLRW